MEGSGYDVIVGQVHGHYADKSGYNADGSSGYTYNTTEIKQGASTDDASAAQTLNVPVHAIDGNKMDKSQEYCLQENRIPRWIEALS